MQPISVTTQGEGGIRAVQQWLNKEYGENIQKYESCEKTLLQTDGLFGSKTKKACKVVSTKTNTCSRGAQIVQAILYCHKYNPQMFDEVFNKDCEAALKQYQRDHGFL